MKYLIHNLRKYTVIQRNNPIFFRLNIYFILKKESTIFAVVQQAQGICKITKKSFASL